MYNFEFSTTNSFVFDKVIMMNYKKKIGKQTELPKTLSALSLIYGIFLGTKKKEL